MHKYPYLLISDTHYHAWHQFAHVNEDGVNSRLAESLEETMRAVKILIQHGGNTLVHAGDAFHVRGELAPTVLNPVMDVYADIDLEHKVQTFAIAGNHDLEGRESSNLGNASSALKHAAPGAGIVTEREGWFCYPGLVLIPYDHDLNRLRETLKGWVGKLPDASRVDVVIHAPVNGVIKGLPDHGLSAEELADYGFRRVFAGHYHNHKELIPGKVWSIGALTHQTWGDVGSKAGFMLVFEDSVSWFSTHAPKFIDITDMTDDSEIELAVDGNYVRAKIAITDESEVRAMRERLEACGAKGVLLNVERDLSGVTRAGSTVSAGASLNVSVMDFVSRSGFAHEEAVKALCMEVLSKVAE